MFADPPLSTSARVRNTYLRERSNIVRRWNRVMLRIISGPPCHIQSSAEARGKGTECSGPGFDRIAGTIRVSTAPVCGSGPDCGPSPAGLRGRTCPISGAPRCGLAPLIALGETLHCQREEIATMWRASPATTEYRRLRYQNGSPAAPGIWLQNFQNYRLRG